MREFFYEDYFVLKWIYMFSNYLEMMFATDWTINFMFFFFESELIELICGEQFALLSAK